MTFLQDIRYALRTLRRSAALTLVIIMSFAIGIGANTAIFSVVNALLILLMVVRQGTELAGAGTVLGLLGAGALIA